MHYNNLETHYGGLLLLTINPLNRGRYTNLFNHIHNRYLHNSLVNLSSDSLEVKNDTSNTNPSICVGNNSVFSKPIDSKYVYNKKKQKLRKTKVSLIIPSFSYCN